MDCLYEQKPEGVFFAVYSDLSGATLFYLDDFGYYVDALEHEQITKDYMWLMDAGYLWFFNIDEGYLSVLQEQQNDK